MIGKTTKEQFNDLAEDCINEEIALGQYARSQIPIQEIINYLSNDKKVWFCRDDLLKLIDDVYERYVVKCQDDERKEPVNTTLGVWIDSVNHPISAMRAELIEKIRKDRK